ncbi:MAG: antibiotic transporter [Verrucomicrobia bacterium]|nr:antibiotic transporter [Verrucomicrobiota bacterium]MBS0637201.1 antibiotic transporter [Verrucomicrobiota bacterium]
MTLLTLTLILFLIMDPIGHVKAFLRCLEGIEPRRQTYIIWREMFIALAFMLGFAALGEVIFSVLAISNTTVYLASGLILFLVAIKIIFPHPDDEVQNMEGEPFIVPMAIPLVAGPALLATIMLYAETEVFIMPMIGAILIAWLASSIILINSKRIIGLLGTSGITACEKLMGMVLVLISVQRLAAGVIMLFNQ